MSAKPRLLHIFSTFNLGGPQARAVQLINAWGGAYEHAIVSVGRGELAARSGIGQGIAVDFPDFPDLKAGALVNRLVAIRRRIAELRPTLVLTYNWGAVEVIMSARLIGGAPVVHHEDGFGPDESGHQLPRRVWFRRMALPAARRLIVPSRVLERIARQQWRQPAAKLLYIPNGVDVPKFAAPSPDAIPGLTRDGSLIVGTLAGLREEKNLPRLVRAFAAAARGSAARLVIVGTGPERARIETQARDSGVADQLIMPGFLPNPERYVGMFDIFALSSDTEQFPISLVEAMAAGVPAACTAVGDISEIVSEENLRFVVPKEDEAALAQALRTLLADRDLRRRIGAENRSRVARQFSIEEMSSRYRTAYDGAMRA